MLKYVSTSINKNMNLKTLKYPISVYLKLTTKCMLKCEFCSQAGKAIDEINLEDAKKILDELHTLGIVYIYIILVESRYYIMLLKKFCNMVMI